MIRVESTQPLFQKINNILLSKQYPDEIKKEIKENIFKMCLIDNVDPYELEQLINNIIEAIKKLETIEIDTREHLCKIPKIKGRLSDNIGGYVTISKKDLIVIKEKFYDISLIHELIHLTQDKNSYHLPNNYDYFTIIKKAMVEGEASYYQALYTKTWYLTLVEGESRLRNRINSKEYNVFLEFY